MILYKSKLKVLLNKPWKKYFYLLIAFIAVFLILFIGVVVLKYSGKARFYQPITISCGTDTACFTNFEVYGETMFGRKTAFLKTGNFYTSGIGFARGIVIGAKDSLWKTQNLLTIKSGSEVWSFKMSDIAAKWDVQFKNNGRTYYFSAEEIKSSENVFFFFLSVFNWNDGRYLLFTTCIAFLFILFAFIFRDFRSQKTSRSFFRFLVTVILPTTLLFILIYQLAWLRQIHITIGLIAVMVLFFMLYWLTALIFIKKLKNRQNIRLSLFVIFLLWFITEVILRFTGMATYSERNTGFYQSLYQPANNSWYKTHLPGTDINLQTTEYCFPRKTNSFGLSDAEPNQQKDTSEFLIIALGDSFTEGDGTDADSTWLKFLEKDLSPKGFHDIKFLNAGICGSDPFYEYVLLRDKLINLKPDLVIVSWGYEMEDVICRGGFERFLENKTVKYKCPPWWENIYAMSFIYRLVAERVIHINPLLLTPEQYKNESDVASNKIKNIIDLYKELSIKNNFDLLFVFYPMKDEVLYQKYKYWDEIISYANSRGLETVNLLNYYIKVVGMNNQNIEKYYWPKDGHNKSAGYRVFAEGIEKSLVKNLSTDSIGTHFHKNTP